MIGWINLSVEAFICDSFGRDAWLRIVKEAHADCSWVSSCPYPDKVTYDLVITGAGILGVSVPQALEAYGQYFVNYVIKQGYLRLMRSLGSNIAEFLANLNNLHLHLSMSFPSMVAPAFRVEQVTSGSLLLHYHSIRPALWPIVSGVLKGASKVLFGHEVEIELLASREAGDSDHEVFRVSYPYQASLAAWDDARAALASEYGMGAEAFFELFPFHLLLDAECRVVQVGSVMARLFGGGGDGSAGGGGTLTRGSHVGDTFKLRHPYIPFEYERMMLESDTLFLLKALQTGLEFKGQMIRTCLRDGRPALLFLGSPRLANLEEMAAHGLYLSDIPLHDMSRDFVLLAEQRQAEADLKERFEKMAVDLRLANEALEQTTRWLDEERQRSDALLYRMLPADIAADLREGRKVEAINYPEVTILFSDMVGFTTTSARSTAEEVYNMLNEMYDRFDGLVDDFPDIYKLETIGDAYFLVCNLTTQCDNHVDVVIDFAIRMQAMARLVKNAQGEPVQIRIGIHTGPVVGGVLGAKTPRFSIYGDTVNVASRMESHGLPGKIHISGAAYARIVNKGKYAVRERGNIAVKGRGNMTTYLIGGINDDWLLRHTSFDAQLDGAYHRERESAGSAASATGLRESSFVITASARSLENLGNRSTKAMEAIKEGDEDRNSRQVGSSGGGSTEAYGAEADGGGSGRPAGPGACAAPGAANAGRLPSGGSYPGGSGSYSSGSGLAALQAVIASLPANGSNSSGGGAEPRAPPSGPAAPPLPPSGAFPPQLPRNSRSFREVGSLREGSFREPLAGLVPTPPPGLGREKSYRAVYARGGRPHGPNSPVIVAASGGSRSYHAGGGGGGGMPHGGGGSGSLHGYTVGEGEGVGAASGPLALLAEGNGSGAGMGGGISRIGSNSHMAGGGGSGGMSRVGSHSQLGYTAQEPSLLHRPEASGGSVLGSVLSGSVLGGSGLGGGGNYAGVGMVMARSVTAKASPLALSGSVPAPPPAPLPPVATVSPREASKAALVAWAPAGNAASPFAAAQEAQQVLPGRTASGALPPLPSALAQRSGGASSYGGSEAGASAAGGEGSGAASGSKAKSLAKKLKSLFKAK